MRKTLGSVAFLSAVVLLGYGTEVQGATYTSPGYTAGQTAISSPYAFNYNGSIASTDTWTRPTAISQWRIPTSATSTGRNYNAVTFTPSITASYLWSTSGSVTGAQTMLYDGTFNPASPLTNIVTGTSTTSAWATPVLTAGQNYVFVTTASSAGVTGNYNLRLNRGAYSTEGAKNIPNGTGASVTYTINVTDPGTVSAMNTVTLLGLRHHAVGDLLITLTHVESGKTVDILDHLGDGGHIGRLQGNFGLGDYSFKDSGGAAYPGTSFDISTGTYNVFNNAGGSLDVTAGNNPLSYFVGDSIAGTWTLTVLDDYAGTDRYGSIAGFSFDASVAVPEPASLGIVGTAGLLALRRRSR